MEPLDLTKQPPRGPRETLLGVYFLPRTIDKMRANLPGGNLGHYIVDLPTGFTAFTLKRIGIDQTEMQSVVAAAQSEDEVVAWLQAHADLSDVAGVNARLEKLTLDRLSPEHQAQVRDYHPIARERPDLTNFLDIFEFDDRQHGAQP